MNGSVVKPPLFEDEGALHVGKGKFLLFMSGETDGGTVSTRKKLIAMIIAVVVVIVAILVTTLIIGHQANEMPYETKLSRLLGSSMTTVIEELDLQQTDWGQLGEREYKLNKGCNLSGVPFELKICFDEDGRLCSYSYLAEYSADSKKAASDLYKIAIDLHVKAYQTEETKVPDLRYSSLKQQFDDGSSLTLAVTNSNSYKNVVNDPVALYLNELEAAEDWPGRVGDYVVRQAVCYYDIRMEYAPESEVVLIHITNTVEQEREK